MTLDWLVQAVANFLCLFILVRAKAPKPLLYAQAFSVASELVLDSFYFWNAEHGWQMRDAFENLWYQDAFVCAGFEMLILRCAVSTCIRAVRWESGCLAVMIALHQLANGIYLLGSLPFHVPDTALRLFMAYCNLGTMAAMCMFAYAVSDATASGVVHEHRFNNPAQTAAAPE